MSSYFLAHRICRGKFALLLLMLVSSACFYQFDPYADLLTTKEPDTADVLGTYVLKEQTLTDENLDFLQGKQATLEISANSTFTTTNFPIWLEKTDITDYKVNKLLSVTGEWKIGKVGSVSSDGNDIKSIWGIHFSGEIDSAGLTGDKPPYGLIFTYGDPDNGDVMIFEKAE